MPTVGIMHTGSQGPNQANITTLQTSLNTAYAGATYLPTRWANDDPRQLPQLAQQLLGVDLLIAAGGSRSAVAAKTARGSATTPIIVFTSVAPYVLINLPQNMTGVCAHTSDHEKHRFRWLAKMGFHGNRIGVLYNSDRTDYQQQLADLNGEAGAKWTVRARDIKPAGIKDAVQWLQGDIHALIVTADPVFTDNRQLVTDLVKTTWPAIFQWKEFVVLGGLMSFGPSLPAMYTRAGAMAGGILGTGTIPPLWEAQDHGGANGLGDFELWVNNPTLQHFGLTVPAPVAAVAQYV